ncbi:MAG TPA: hypothetical protein DCR93_23625, partial [Cytophagales bacterium]|nr:hypothetical protein [Cytophagales bacterium]
MFSAFFNNGKTYKPMNRKLSTLLVLLAVCISAYAQQYDPGSGNTLMLVGQTFQSEYDGYKSGTGLTPAG